jgi:hypothetical protein
MYFQRHRVMFVWPIKWSVITIIKICAVTIKIVLKICWKALSYREHEQSGLQFCCPHCNCTWPNKSLISSWLHVRSRDSVISDRGCVEWRRWVHVQVYYNIPYLWENEFTWIRNLIPPARELLKKQRVVHLLRKFPTIYGARSVIYEGADKSLALYRNTANYIFPLSSTQLSLL